MAMWVYIYIYGYVDMWIYGYSMYVYYELIVFLYVGADNLLGLLLSLLVLRPAG